MRSKIPVDGDGLADVLVSALYQDFNGSSSGTAYLFLSSSLGSATRLDLTDSDYTFSGITSRHPFGWAISSAGDVDGGGQADILIGSYGRFGGNAVGNAYLFLGENLGTDADLSANDADYTFEPNRWKNNA